jgi:hypothetical protein
MARYPTDTPTHQRYSGRVAAALDATHTCTGFDTKHVRNLLAAWLDGARKPPSGHVLRCLDHLEATAANLRPDR